MQDLTPPRRSAPTQWPGLRRRLQRQGRLAAARVWNRPVAWELYGRTLMIPLSSELPYFMDSGGSYATNVGRLAAALVEAGAAPVAVDVGANVGDTAHILLAHVPHMQVLCVEADPGYFDNLVVNTRELPTVATALCLLDEGSGAAGRAITRRRGTGAVVQVGGTGLGAAAVPTASLPELLEQHPAFAQASLFKTDTDGYDFQILTGALPWLAERRPVVFTEYDPTLTDRATGPGGPTGPQALAALAACGYGPALLWDNCGFPHAHLDVRDSEAVADLDLFVRLRPDFYVDMAVFPVDQASVAAGLRTSERAFFA
jgi:FkbM family methyltransferase